MLRENAEPRNTPRRIGIAAAYLLRNFGAPSRTTSSSAVTPVGAVPFHSLDLGKSSSIVLQRTHHDEEPR